MRGIRRRDCGPVCYWDYSRDVDIGEGKTGKEFLFVELNSQTGSYRIWRGREFF